MTRQDRYVAYAAAALTGIAARPNVSLIKNTDAVAAEAHQAAASMLQHEPAEIRANDEREERTPGVDALVGIGQCLEAMLSFKRAEHERAATGDQPSTR